MLQANNKMGGRGVTTATKRLVAWHDVFESNLAGVKWLKHEAFLISNLESLNVGLKAGFLWDHPPIPSKDQLQKTITALKTRSLLSASIHIVELGQDLLIVNIQCLLCRVSEPEHFYQFVDISEHLDGPKLVGKSVLISQTLVLLASQLKSLGNSTKLCNDTTCFKLKFDATQTCVPTLLGLCLGYPVVYWYFKHGQESFLSNEKLTVFSIEADISKEYKSVSIFSFSVPTLLQSKVANHISNWLESSYDASLRCLLGNVVLKEKTFINASVIL